MKLSLKIVVIGILAVIIGLMSLVYGLERQERYECAKLQSQAKELNGFYLTDWQIKMCQRYEQN